MSQGIKHVLRKSITSAYSWAGLKPEQKGHRILMYHSIGERVELDPTNFFTVSLENFKKQLHFIQEKEIPVVSVDDISLDYEQLNLSITFDDGYKNNLTIAAPLLIQYKFPFTVFVATKFVENGHRDFMSEEQLKELSKIEGVTIGSHSASHKPLTQLNDDDLKIELAQSKKYLEDLLQKEIHIIAYPYGDVDQRVRNMAETVGYSVGVCSRFHINMGDRDPLLLNRTELNAPDSLYDFKGKVKGYWDWYRFRHEDPADE